LKRLHGLFEDNFVKANMKCKKAEETSGLSTTESELEHESRRKRCRIQLTDESDSGNIEQSVNNPSRTVNREALPIAKMPEIPALLINSSYKTAAVGEY
jgi:hypothetical protein